MLFSLFVLDNEPQPQEGRDTEAMEIENFTDVSNYFLLQNFTFQGEGTLETLPCFGAECSPVLSLNWLF